MPKRPTPKTRKPRKPTVREEIDALKKEIEELKRRPALLPRPNKEPLDQHPWDNIPPSKWPIAPYEPKWNPWRDYIKD